MENDGVDLPRAACRPKQLFNSDSRRSTPETFQEKRKDFRDYIEMKQLRQSIATSLVGLYHMNPRPSNPVEFFVERLSKGCPNQDELTKAKEDLEKAKKRILELEATNAALQERLSSYEDVMGNLNCEEVDGEECDEIETNFTKFKKPKPKFENEYSFRPRSLSKDQEEEDAEYEGEREQTPSTPVSTGDFTGKNFGQEDFKKEASVQFEETD